jgi:hypothetical protein
MRTIIAGSRDLLYPLDLVTRAVNSYKDMLTITCVLSGTARGIDRAGEEWAKAHNIPIEYYPANWDEFGKAAGFIRNREMALRADALLAVWDGKSRGTANMIRTAALLNLETFTYKIENEESV